MVRESSLPLRHITRARGFVLVALMACSSAAFLPPATAHAQPLAGDRAVALAQEGQAAYEKGEWEEAFSKFQAADAIVPAPPFRLYMARARKNQDRLLEARGIYKSIVSMQIAADAPPTWGQAQSDARAELTQLDASIPTIVVTVEAAPPGALQLSVDRKPIVAGQSVEVDPGQHTVVAIVDGKEASKTFNAAPSQKSQSVTVSFGKVDIVPPPGETSSSPLPALGWTFLGVGAASLIAGIGTGAAALSMDQDVYSELKACQKAAAGDCQAEKDKEKRLLAIADASTATLVIGGVLAATGVTLLIVGATTSSSSAPAKTGIWLTISPWGLGLMGRID